MSLGISRDDKLIKFDKIENPGSKKRTARKEKANLLLYYPKKIIRASKVYKKNPTNINICQISSIKSLCV